MAESSGSSVQKGEEIVVKIDGKETENASKSTGESSVRRVPGSVKKFKVSFEEVLTEALKQRRKNTSGPEKSLRSGDEDGSQSVSDSSFARNSWRVVVNKAKSRLIDPPEEPYQRNDGMSSAEEFHDEDDGDIEDISEEYKCTKLGILTLLQWVSLALISAAWLCSITIPAIKRQKLWDLPLWKWEIMVLALICGRLISGCAIRIVVIIIERNFLLRKRVLYFVYGLKKAVQNCLWLGLVLLVWHFVFDEGVKKESKSQVLTYVTRMLVCFLAGNLIWLVKTLLVKVLASSFHVSTFFERIQEALFNQYVIETLSNPPVFELHRPQDEEEQESQNAGNTQTGNLREPLLTKNHKYSSVMSGKKEEKIRIEQLQKLNQKNISAWNMRRMINIFRHGRLATLHERILNSGRGDESAVQIRSESQAKEAAKKIFQNVAKPDSQIIDLDDMMRFMGREEAVKAMQLFGATCKDEGISKSLLNDWLVKALRERRALGLSLNDTKTAVDELHNMLNILVAIIIVIISLFILGIPVTHFLVFISSQLLVAVFIFGDTCKRTFEAIIFLFVMHPFDVGDRCEIDQVQMIVEEMNLLTTVFLRHDHQKVTYPNSVLSTKPIGNFYRSPDMIEIIEFCIHISTPTEKIALMKEKIIQYIQSKEEHWQKNPTVALKDVEDMNKLKFMVWSKHRMNYQNMMDRWVRRGLLMEEMIKVFRDLGIEYRLLPLDVNVHKMPALVSLGHPSN
ncbi:hypothetical protein SLE2022_217780 [Rubroshorea leprosula]